MEQRSFYFQCSTAVFSQQICLLYFFLLNLAQCWLSTWPPPFTLWTLQKLPHLSGRIFALFPSLSLKLSHTPFLANAIFFCEIWYQEEDERLNVSMFAHALQHKLNQQGHNEEKYHLFVHVMKQIKTWLWMAIINYQRLKWYVQTNHQVLSAARSLSLPITSRGLVTVQFYMFIFLHVSPYLNNVLKNIRQFESWKSFPCMSIFPRK